ncbi:hypothetical protein GHK92_09790 [Nocardioides sp. dk4132]|uniref:hypothetical protein n=1 Tax=unclassified Nocardioides TaxID=2615069 RepID=UPI001296BBE4|nr:MULTISPECIES: hypothetical protein [unclassified Nocardioides]MQW76166.1 hypothetical protein [Nocardioides sp. dk4132]QGA09000.1 hypothetical protein GFH29_17545 [Nocardioides sp. dk884]
MHLRRKLTLAVSATVLAVPVLSSCGFDYATDRVYTPAAGTNNRDEDVDVVGAVVVAAQPGSGTFVAGLSNNDPDEPRTLVSVAGEGVNLKGLKDLEIPPRGYVNLADEDVHVDGEVAAGGYVTLQLEFDTGDAVELNVPVVTNCDEFEGMDTSVQTGSGEELAEAYSCEFPHSESEGEAEH